MKYSLPFYRYKESLFEIANDFSFWSKMLKSTTEEIQNKTFLPPTIFSSIYHVYDIDETSSKGNKRFFPTTEKYTKDNLLERNEKFINWTMNLSLLRAYNNVEILLLESIWLTFYSNQGSPTGNRKNTTKLNYEIVKELNELDIKSDKSNNRHIVKFLSTKNCKFEKFSRNRIRIDIDITWAEFFEFISVLRNIVSHQDSCYDRNTLNELKSKSAQLYSKYFRSIKVNEGLFQLTIIQEQFGNFLSLYNDFAINTLKFIANENDMSFLGMQDPSINN